MKSLICGASLAAVVLAAGVVSAVDASADEPASVEVVMKKLFAGKAAPNNTLKAAAKGAPVDWAKAKEVSDTFAKFGPELGKNEAPKGDKASWAKLTKALADECKALGSAVDAKDEGKYRATAKAISSSCKSCHDAHRPE